MTVTENSKLTFGKHKGIKLRDCPTSYLKWMIENLKGGDFNEWALVAETLYATKAKEEADSRTLESQADDFLRSFGYNPRKL